MDLTLTVITHEKASTDPLDPGRWRNGEVVQVRALEAVPGVAATLPYSYLHVTGVPPGIGLEQIKRLFEADHVATGTADVDPPLVARRLYLIDASELPAGFVSRQATVSWAALFAATWRRADNSQARGRRGRPGDI